MVLRLSQYTADQPVAKDAHEALPPWHLPRAFRH